jgi:aerobic-type carbon monoxide dehydrogenase small subunit (CoxS/CutS family)
VSDTYIPSRGPIAKGLKNFAFIARASPCEINIDHAIHSPLVMLVENIVQDGIETIESLDQVVNLLKQAQSAVLELLASVGLPSICHILIFK